jgi:hypothetical protein
MPSRPRPDLMTMQSSRVSNVQSSTRTSLQHSTSQPSLLGPWLTTLTPLMVTFSLWSGCSPHMGEFLRVNP